MKKFQARMKTRDLLDETANTLPTELSWMNTEDLNHPANLIDKIAGNGTPV